MHDITGKQLTVGGAVLALRYQVWRVERAG